MDALIGQQWGSYRLVRFLGRGSFAEVYLGEHGRWPIWLQSKFRDIHARPAINTRWGLWHING